MICFFVICWNLRFFDINVFLMRVDLIVLMFLWILDLEMLNKVDNILFEFFFFSFIRNIVKFVFIVFDGVGFNLVFIYFSMFLKVVFEMFRRLM